jgi:gluconokinase
MRKEVCLGLDVGTSATKYTALELSTGNVVAQSRVEYARSDAAVGVVPMRMYTEALEHLLGDVAQEFIVRSVALTTAWYSAISPAEGGDVVYQWNSIWERNAAVERELSGHLDVSGCHIDILFPVYKLMTAHLLGDMTFRPYGMKEYLIEWLTGERATDYSTASASGLLDIRTRDWNEPLLDRLGYRREEMARLSRHNSAVGETKIRGESITVVPGLGDGASASYACKSVSEVAANIGSTMAARELSPVIRHSSPDRTWTFVVDESRYVNGGISSNGGSVLEWARRAKWAIDDVRVSQGGERFYPWLHGERTPFWSADLRGTFAGIDVHSDMTTLSAAIVKGVAFTLSRMINAMAHARSCPSGVVVAGGGVRLSEMLRVVQGSVGVPLTILKSFDYLASDGAALSAAEALGVPLVLHHDIETVLEPNGAFEADYEDWVAEADCVASNVYKVATADSPEKA